jgi:hypothetical protein
MKKILFVAMIVVFICPAFSASARDTQHMYLYEDIMNTEETKGKLNLGIKFYFGDQSHPEVDRKLGTFVSNK